MRKLFLLLFGVVFFALQAMAQQRTITGKVIDEKGQPVANASVMVKGTTAGTSTNVDGSYTLTLPPNASILVITSVGMETIEVKISSTANYNVQLKATDKSLEEVVVVAFGTVKKADFMGSAARIKGSDISERPNTNVLASLVGASPGVQTNAGSGQPGSAPDIRIRGFGSINAANDPLYVVDGIPFSGSVANINSFDIEDITVLKDASSTSLYGARAANGVVMITTRKGKKGTKPLISLDINRGSTDRAIPEYDRVNAYDYYPVIWQAIRNSLIYRTSPLTPAAAANQASTTIKSLLGYNPFNVADNSIVGLDGKLNPAAQLLYKPEDLDWEKSISRYGQRSNINLAVSGGQDKTDYFFSLGYLDEKAYIIRSDYKRYNGRINVNTQVTSWFKTGLNLSGTFTKSNQASSTGTTANVNPFGFTRNMGPIYPVYAYIPGTNQYLRDGLGNVRYDYGNLSAFGLPNRPGALAGRHITAETELNKEDFKRNFWGARTFGEITFLKNFKFTTNLSVDVTNRSDLQFYNKEVGDGAPSGSITKSTQTITGINIQEILNYNKTIKGHNFDVMVGHENNDYKQEDFSAGRTVQIVSGIYELVNFSTPGSSTSTSDNHRVEGYFSRLGYNYEQKYYAGLSFRRDGSSRFEKDKRWGSFWSVNAAWVLSKEKAFMDLKAISYLKLRFSHGTAGNDRGIGFYASKPLFTLGFNNALEPGTYQASLGNRDLEWEANKQTDVALEFGLFKNRLNGVVEYFNRVSDNLLFDVPLPLSSGITTQTRNIGSMYNRGFELNLNGDVLLFGGFKWNMNLNLTKVKNRITKLPQEEIISGTKKLKVGQSLYDYWLRDYRGVDPADGAVIFLADNSTGAGVRVVKGETVTTNINNAKFNYVGSAIPDYYGSLTNTFTYKGFELSVLTTFQKGGKVYDVTYANLMSPGTYGSASHIDVLRAWKNPGDETGIPRMDVGQTGIFNAASSRWLTDASFMNFRSVSISYNISPELISRFRLKSARFSVTGENLHLFSKRKGMNVEESFTGVTSPAFIPARVISAGINVTF